MQNSLHTTFDQFPYNGTTTTCEALWMGVPVVTLRGDRHRGRVGTSLLTQAGLTDWIAGSMEEYLEIAATLAGDPYYLNNLRRSVRARGVVALVRAKQSAPEQRALSEATNNHING